ncbi:MAG TPA: hypothetical protein ENJ50_00540 [Planctomycetaceae bacterium]|nr:hypothetical protein [Planctomycetaceae bacterium]
MGRRLQLNASSGTPQDLLPLLEYAPDDLLVDDPRQALATLETWRTHRGKWQWLRERVDVRGGATIVPWIAEVGAPTFLNRNYTMLELPDGLQGRPRWMFAGGEGDRVTMRFRKATVVFAVFEYNDTGLWSFPLKRPPYTFGWRPVPGQKYRGTSNGMLGGRTHYGQIYVRHFAAGEELGEMPKWWICLAVVEPSDALRLPGYRKAIEGEPPAPPFSYYDWATRPRPLQVPPFESHEQWARWQEETRVAFRQRLLFAYDGVPRVVTLSEPREREGYTEQALAFELQGKRLFRFFRLVPRTASETAEARRMPTIVCFMGHGKVRQILEEEDSYQHACAARFAREGYLVYAMENVGMEPDADRHLELDRILRLDGYGWYSLLFAHQQMLLNHVFNDKMADIDQVGVTGVSTGGLLALTAIAMEPRVRAASVQGIFGSMRYSFIRDRNRHCSCGAIPGLLPRFDLPELALLAAPRPLHISNAQQDGFPPAEARRCVEQIRPIYEKVGGKVLRFTDPPGRHEYAWKEALAFFQEVMRKPGTSQAR